MEVKTKRFVAKPFSFSIKQYLKFSYTKMTLLVIFFRYFYY